MQKTMKAEIAALNSESGEWRYSSLELPAKKYEIEDAMHRAGIVAAETYREYSLYGCELLPQLSQLRPDSPSIEELNYLAKRLSELNEEERLVLRAVAPKYLDSKAEEGLVSVKDLINLTYGLGKVSLASNIDNYEELGQLAIDSEMVEGWEEVPEQLKPYFDRGKLGREKQKEDGGVFLDGKYIYAGDYRLEEVYNGRDLPVEKETEDYIFRLKLARVSEACSGASESERKSEWIALPIARSKADAFAKALGADRIEECVYLDFESAIPQISSEQYGDMQDFDKLNSLAEKLLQLPPSEQIKYKAILSAEEPKGIEELLKAVRELGRYEFAPQAEDAAQFFKSYLLRHTDTKFDPKWLDTLTIRSESQELVELLGAKVTDYGVISARDRGLYGFVARYGSEILNESYDVIEINGQKALFANEAIRSEAVPEGLYKYDLRGGETEDFVTIEPRVVVDRTGTILVKEPFDFGGKDHIRLTEETSPNFLGIEATLQEFLETDYEQEEETLETGVIR